MRTDKSSLGALISRHPAGSSNATHGRNPTIAVKFLVIDRRIATAGYLIYFYVESRRKSLSRSSRLLFYGDPGYPPGSDSLILRSFLKRREFAADKFLVVSSSAVSHAVLVIASLIGLLCDWMIVLFSI